jgi:murein DD-endopeptidase
MQLSGSAFLLPVFAALVLAAGCASTPVADVPGDARQQEASEIAASMVGKPYRYGGNTPQGFDCSGLVYFSFRRAGMDVPRSTESQRDKSRKVSTARLARGDLLFFNQEGKYSSHVGIYLGRNRFVHAPSSGKHVRLDSLADPYWRKHLVDTRRF